MVILDQNVLHFAGEAVLGDLDISNPRVLFRPNIFGWILTYLTHLFFQRVVEHYDRPYRVNVY